MLETEKLDDINRVVIATSPDGNADLRQAGRPGDRRAQPRLGIVGRGATRTTSSRASS